jgi:hypothetical protein
MKNLSIWSKEHIDKTTIAIHPKHLVPWFKSQIQEIKEEIGKAASEVKKLNLLLNQAKEKLKSCKDDKERKLCEGAIWSIEAQISRSDLVYLEGRIYILERHIKYAQ